MRFIENYKNKLEILMFLLMKNFLLKISVQHPSQLASIYAWRIKTGFSMFTYKEEGTE